MNRLSVGIFTGLFLLFTQTLFAQVEPVKKTYERELEDINETPKTKLGTIKNTLEKKDIYCNPFNTSLLCIYKQGCYLKCNKHNNNEAIYSSAVYKEADILDLLERAKFNRKLIKVQHETCCSSYCKMTLTISNKDIPFKWIEITPVFTALRASYLSFIPEFLREKKTLYKLSIEQESYVIWLTKNELDTILNKKVLINMTILRNYKTYYDYIQTVPDLIRASPLIN